LYRLLRSGNGKLGRPIKTSDLIGWYKILGMEGSDDPGGRLSWSPPRGFYHQRSGIALGEPYTTFKRQRPFHPDDGLKVYASKAPLMDTGNGLNKKDSINIHPMT
jgi:hypothetical protein